MFISKLIILSLFFSATLQDNFALNLDQDNFQSILQNHFQQTISFPYLPDDFLFRETMKCSLTSFTFTIPDRKDIKVKFYEPRGMWISFKNPVFVFDMPCISKENTSKILIQHVEFTVSDMKLDFEIYDNWPSFETADFSEGHGIIDGSKKFKTKASQNRTLEKVYYPIPNFNALVYKAFSTLIYKLHGKLYPYFLDYAFARVVTPFKVTGKTAHFVCFLREDFRYVFKADSPMKVTPEDPQGLYVNLHTLENLLIEKYNIQLDTPYFYVKEGLKSISELIEPEILLKTSKNLDELAEMLEISAKGSTVLGGVRTAFEGSFIRSFINSNEEGFHFMPIMKMQIPADNKFGFIRSNIKLIVQINAKLEQNILKINWIKTGIKDDMIDFPEAFPEDKREETQALVEEILLDLTSNFERTLNNLDISPFFDLSQFFGLSNVPMDVERFDTGVRFNITK